MPGLGLIILAAGASTRMKKPKQLLRWGDETLLRVACKTALKTDCRPVIVVLGCEPEACQANVQDLAVMTVVNPCWEKGMGASIGAGITELERIAPNIDGSLILLVDQPTVTAQLLNSLIAAWKSSRHAISATSYDGAGGVPAVFDRCFFWDLKCLDPVRGARPLIMREQARASLVDPGDTLIDLDTQESYLREAANFAAQR